MLLNRFIPALFLSAATAAGCGHEHEEHASHHGALAAPTELSAMVVVGGVHLSWRDNCDDEDEFMVVRKDPSSGWAAIGTTPADGTFFHDATVVRGNSYTYIVHAMRAAASSAPSNEATVLVR